MNRYPRPTTSDNTRKMFREKTTTPTNLLSFLRPTANQPKNSVSKITTHQTLSRPLPLPCQISSKTGQPSSFRTRRVIAKKKEKSGKKWTLTIEPYDVMMEISWAELLGGYTFPPYSFFTSTAVLLLDLFCLFVCLIFLRLCTTVVQIYPRFVIPLQRAIKILSCITLLFIYMIPTTATHFLFRDIPK